MSFSRHIALTLFCVALAAAFAVGAMATKLMHGDWTAVFAYVPLVPILVYEWRLISRQRPLASAAEELRQLRKTIPAHTQRLYLPTEGNVAVLCHSAASLWRTHQFTCLQLDDVADLDRAEAEEVIYLGATTYKMSVGLPLVQRTMWAEGTVKHSKHGDFHGLPRQRQTLKGALRSMWLDHKAGVLTPTANELSQVAHIMHNARTIIDTPIGPTADEK